MLKYFANFCLISGVIGFSGYLFLIMASTLGCCLGITTSTFSYIVITIITLCILVFGFCMFNNCCKIKKA